MKASLEKYLKDCIGENIRVNLWNGQNKFALYLLDQYRFYETELLGKRCLFVEVLRESPGVDTLKKHLKAISKAVDIEPVFLYKTITRFRRKTLIEHRIPFVVEDGQMFLPFIGLFLRRTPDTSTNISDAFSSSTQLAFLYFLYHPEVVLNTTTLAGIINKSAMTAYRCLNELYKVGLLTYEIVGKTGRSKNYRRIGDPDYYREGCRYLKNPIGRIVYTQKEVKNGLVAGVEALSLFSMVNPPPHPVRALYQELLCQAEQDLVTDKDRIADERLTMLELWRYDPKLVSDGKHVDIVSLELSLRELNDERLEGALQERMKGESWYTG